MQSLVRRRKGGRNNMEKVLINEVRDQNLKRKATDDEDGMVRDVRTASKAIHNDT